MIMATTVGFHAHCQDAFAVKKWSGRYPTMNNDYPLAFVCWKGWLPPVPHFFIRIYPTHYYYYLYSLPVYDVKSYLDMGLYGGLKLVLKELDQSTLSKTLDEVSGIQLNQLDREEIGSFLRESRLEALPDIFGNNEALFEAGESLNLLSDASMPSWLHRVFEEEIRIKEEALEMLNQMDCSQGDKLKAEENLNRELQALNGTILYVSQKVGYWQHYSRMKESHLDFMGVR